MALSMALLASGAAEFPRYVIHQMKTVQKSAAAIAADLTEQLFSGVSKGRNSKARSIATLSQVHVPARYRVQSTHGGMEAAKGR